MELIPDTFLGLSESELERAFEQAFAGEMMEASEPSEKAFWSKSRHSRFYEDFDEIEEIGRGAFGVVFKCRCKLDGQVYAVKCINIPSSAPKARIDKILREVELLAQVQHPHIVRYFAAWCEFTQDVQTPEKGSSKSNNVKVAGGFRSDPSGTNRCDPQQGRPVTPVKATSAGGDDRVPSLAFTPPSYPRDEETGRKLYIQMEYCPLDLSKCLKDEDTKKKLSAPKIFGQLVAGVECLHSCGILHRDLAPKNVFLDSDLNVKLGDLGSAKAGCWVSGYIGTPWYIAPEVNTRGNELSDKADVYALGVIAQELWQKLGRPAPPGVEPLLADIPARRPSSKEILTEERYRHLVEQVSD